MDDNLQGRFATFQGRIEDARLVSGAGEYVDDLTFAGTLHAVLVRADEVGSLTSIDVTTARAAPGVRGIWTAEDLAKSGPTEMLCGVGAARPDGETAFQAARPVLARNRVRFVGEGLAFVVADTRAAAEDAAALIEVEIASEDTVVDARAARQPGAPLVWDEVPENIAYLWARGDADAAATAVASAPHRVALDALVPRCGVHAMEPRASLGRVEDGRLVLHSCSQSPHAMKGQIAKIFDRDASDVRVISKDVGGSFGMKITAYVEDVLVLVAAEALGKPVKWTGTRTDSSLADDHGRDIRVKATLGFDDDGTLLGLTTEFDVNIGAYLSGRSLGSLGNFGGISGVYRIGPTSATAYGVHTNTHTVGPYRGAGRPEATFAIERLMDLAARKLGRDPYDFRMQNLVPSEAMPWDTGFMFQYDCGEFAENMIESAATIDRAGFAERKAKAAARGRLLGLGMSNPIEVAGGPFVKPGADHCRVTINPDGSAVIHAGVMSVGQGLHTAFTDLLGARLGLSRDQITYAQGDTDDLPGGRGSGGSASAPTGGSSLTLAIDGVIAKGTETAADMLEAATADIAFEDGGFRVAGTDKMVTLRAVAEKHAESGNPLAEQSHFEPSKVTFPNGCHMAEVEVDPETGRVEILTYVVTEDVGRVLNPTLLAGQMHGGVYQGAGQAMMEIMAYDEDGQLTTASFMDYAMPRADMMPEVRFTAREVVTEVNPIGAKGVGEAGTVGSLVCVVNAVADALDIDHIDMPLTPETVWRAAANR